MYPPHAASSRDARFVTEVVAGVTRWRRRLDHTIGQLTKGDIESLDAPLRQILRHVVNCCWGLGVSKWRVGVGRTMGWVSWWAGALARWALENTVGFLAWHLAYL